MLIEYKVENYRSIKDELVFSMESTNLTANRVLEFNSTKQGNIDLLKSAIIFGPNGSGKSNLLLSMRVMRGYVEYSRRQAKKPHIVPFLLDINWKNKATAFEVKVLVDNRIYRYGFKVTDKTVETEWLFYKENIPRARENKYFYRQFQNFSTYGVYKKEADLIIKGEKVSEDKLLLPVVSEFNGSISQVIVEWFQKFNVISSIHSDEIASVTYEKLENEQSRSRIVDFVKSSDVGIIDIKPRKISEKELKRLPKELRKIVEQSDAPVQMVQTFHSLYDNGTYVGEVPLALTDESDGSKKIFELSGAFLEILDKGEIFIIDELDNSFHTKLVEAIIKLFNSAKNSKNAQLICAVHDTNLLTQEIFRRDQIWFTDKHLLGETQFCSLIDFGARKDTSLAKNYLAGKYGSIPILSELEYQPCDE